MYMKETSFSSPKIAFYKLTNKQEQGETVVCIVWGILHVKEITSTMSFSSTKGDLKIKIYHFEYTMLQI